MFMKIKHKMLVSTALEESRQQMPVTGDEEVFWQLSNLARSKKFLGFCAKLRASGETKVDAEAVAVGLQLIAKSDPGSPLENRASHASFSLLSAMVPNDYKDLVLASVLNMTSKYTAADVM